MPEYTQEQIDEAMKFLRGITSDSETMNSSIMTILSALSTAERERDENKSKAEQYYKDWYASKAEFGDITAKLRDRVRTAEAQVAELEAKLQGAADRAVACVANDFNSEMRDCWGDYEDNLLRAAIVGKKEGV